MSKLCVKSLIRRRACIYGTAASLAPVAAHRPAAAILSVRSISTILSALTVSIILSALTAQAGEAYTLEGKIEHVEQMPAVEQRFTPGAQWDQNIQLSPNNNWVKIPKWIAGSWSAREETAVLFQDFRSGKVSRQAQGFKAKQDFTYGQQIDKNGQIWHYVGVPYTSKTVHAGSEEIHEVKDKQFLKATDDAFEFRALATVIFVDDLSSRILKTYQQESITTYRPVADDRIAMTASTKVFDSYGKPQTMQDNEAIIKRYRHFGAIDNQDGKDLKSLFIEFMIAKGMGDALPDKLKEAAPAVLEKSQAGSSQNQYVDTAGQNVPDYRSAPRQPAVKEIRFNPRVQPAGAKPQSQPSGASF